MADKLKTAKPKIRVFIVDDHPVVRRGFHLLFCLAPDLEVCGEADSAPSALQKIIALKPEMVVIDLLLQSGSGLELIKQIRSQSLKTKLLVFTMQDEAIYVERALRAGADGYLTKEEGAEKAIDAIRLLLAGKRYLTPSVAEKLSGRLISGLGSGEADFESLSDRELEILEFLGRGFGSREIAETLHLSLKTIESHREHIKTKLGLAGSAELIGRAHDWVHGGAAG